MAFTVPKIRYPGNFFLGHCSSYDNYQNISFSSSAIVSYPNPIDNIIINVPSNSGSSNLCYIRLSFLTTTTSPVLPMDVFLTNPNGTQVLIASNINPQTNAVLTFEDAALQGLSSLSSMTSIPSGYYQGVEDFAKLCDNGINTGNWTLKLVSKDYAIQSGLGKFLPSIQGNLEVWFVPDSFNGNSMNTMNNPPVLNIGSGNLLNLSLPNSFFTGNNSISVTQKLYRTVGFDGTLDYTGNFYRLKMPQVILSSTTPYVVFSQSISTFYMLNQINLVQIRSSNLSVSGEYDVNTSQSIIMSVNIPAGPAKGIYEYAPNVKRFYDLINTGNLRDLNINVWIGYIDGSIKQATLAPYEIFSMLIKFVNKSMTTDRTLLANGAV